MSFRTILLSLVLLSSVILLFSGFFNSEELSKTKLVAFYNVENLFDTIDDPHKSDNEYLPHSKLRWNQEKYNNKVSRISEVISTLDQEDMVLLGLAEIENRTVLESLIQVQNENKNKYAYIQEEGDDPRGIDVALLYNKTLFKPLFHKVLKPCWKEVCLESRDVLAVKGLWNKDTVWVYINHWPSRRAGQEKSEHKRMLVSHVLKYSIDSVSKASPSSKIIVMGDFNDLPSNTSLKELVSGSKLVNVFDKENLMDEGSLKYKKDWFLFDQILVSNNLVLKSGKSIHYKEGSASVFNPLFLHYKKDIKNGPYRTYRGQSYYGGYSDHFPVYLRVSY